MDTLVVSSVFSALFLLSALAGQSHGEELMLPKSFQSFFQLIFTEMSDDNISNNFVEVYNGFVAYDGLQKILAFQMEDLGEINEKIYNFSSNEEIVLQGTKCSENNITEGSVSLLPFPHQNKAGSENILLFDGQEQSSIVGDEWASNRTFTMEEIDEGIQNCMTYHVFEANDDKIHYKVLKNFRIVCKEYTLLVHFLHFRDRITNPEALQQPDGIFCKSKMATIPFPTVPDRFRFTMETIVGFDKQNGATVQSQEVWYDKDFQIVMFNRRANIVHTHEIIIFEYRRGVKYFINAQLKQCRMENITDTMMSQEEALGTRAGSFLKAQYIGEMSSGGVTYNTWATANSDLSEVSDISFIQLDPGSKRQIDVPVIIESFVYSGRNLDVHRHSRIFHYELQPTDWSIFDTTYCFDETDQGVRFRLTIEGTDSLPADFRELHLFEEMIHSELMITLQVTATRISNFQVHHIPATDTIAIVYAQVTESPYDNGYGKLITEQGAQESYNNLSNQVWKRAFKIVVPAQKGSRDKDTVYLGTRVERLSRSVKVPKYKNLTEPDLPASFQTDFTLYVLDDVYRGTLLYDDKQKTVAIHYGIGSTKNFYIYNFTASEELVITEGHDCKAERISSSAISIFPFASSTLNHESQGGAQSILLFDADIKGFINEEVDSFGQMFLKWGSSKDIIIQNQAFSCSLTHWFREDKDETTTLEVMEAQCKLESALETDMTFSFHFSNFKNAIQNTKDLQQPIGIYCKNKISTQPLPQLPDRFRFSGDTFLGLGETDLTASSTFETWYDSESQLLREEIHSSVENMHIIDIKDFIRGVSYYINVMQGSCQVLNVTDERKSIFPKEETLGIKPDYRKAQYAGQRMKNGVAYLVWAVASEDLKYVLDISYVKEPITESLEIAVPVKIDKFDYTLKKHESSRIFSFDLSPHDWSLFDVTKCFNEKQRISFQLTITGTETTPVALITKFSEAIHAKLIQTLQVATIRVGNFQVFQLEKGISIISAVITEKPFIFGAGSDNEEPNAEKAYQNLDDSIRKNSFSFELQSEVENKITYNAKKLEKLAADSAPERSSGYSPGSMAALGLCMLIMGGAIGAFLLVVYIKHKQKHGGGLISAINSDL